jgi:hypothetical protein
MKIKKKYTIKKIKGWFKIYEHYTKQYIAQSRNKNTLTKLLKNLNKGGFFNGDTPKFMLIGGPITVYGQRNTRNI